jgi:hypothetical protein
MAAPLLTRSMCPPLNRSTDIDTLIDANRINVSEFARLTYHDKSRYLCRCINAALRRQNQRNKNATVKNLRVIHSRRCPLVTFSLVRFVLSIN